MSLAAAEALHDDIRRLDRRLREWLTQAAYPLWSTRGHDPVRGGFHERLTQRGEPIRESRRARVQPRQVYAFARGPALGWNGPGALLIDYGLDYFLSRFQRPDGLFLALLDAEDAPLDSRALLYDQAFALLGFGAAQAHGAPSIDTMDVAGQLRARIVANYARPGGGFEATLPPTLPLQANPHMHLLEACLLWHEIGSDPQWRALADDIGHLAITKLIRHGIGTIPEFFDSIWLPAPDFDGRIVEPGHQYEWAWLLLRWSPADTSEAHRVALRLIDVCESAGVVSGVAVNTLLDDFSIRDGVARLWPQTERIKAAALAGRLTGQPRYWQIARDATLSLLPYLDTPLPGLWYDRRLSSGEFVEEPAPASSFYHIVGAIEELHRLSQSGTPRPEDSMNLPPDRLRTTFPADNFT